MTSVETRTGVSEVEKVEMYRFDRLVERGIKPTIAEELSKSECDLHRVLDAKAQGCSDRLLRKIFGYD